MLKYYSSQPLTFVKSENALFQLSNSKDHNLELQYVDESEVSDLPAVVRAITYAADNYSVYVAVQLVNEDDITQWKLYWKIIRIVNDEYKEPQTFKLARQFDFYSIVVQSPSSED